MSSLPETFVIVGAGLAGATAARALRGEGFGGRVILLGEEAERPYERPPLSKDYLRGEAAGRPFVYDASEYEGEWLELRTGSRVVSVDPDASELELEDGESVTYDKLLLTTGAEPRPLPVPGADLEGVHALRTLSDADAIAPQLKSGARVVVVGAGWIGSEVAASARQKGCEVAIIEQGAVPLERVLGPEVGAIYRDFHTGYGVRFLGRSGVEAIEGEERVEGVRTTDGELLAADVVVVGVGVEPRSRLAEGAGLSVDNGIVVGANLETSVAGVFAAGDVANAFHPFYERHLRVEHWANAQAQGHAVARAMLGKTVSYDEIPYFFSDQYDIGMEYRGFAATWDEVVLRGDPDDREFIAFWLEDGRVVAGMNVNVWDVNETLCELIRSRQVLSSEQLADPSVELASLVVSDAAGSRR